VSSQTRPGGIVNDNPHRRDHVKELANQTPKQPFFFLKPASSILNPGEGSVIRPKGVDLHYEVELALIIGKELKNLEASDEKGALDAIESMSPHPVLIFNC
jgi:acylpyruvate hydrolase